MRYGPSGFACSSKNGAMTRRDPVRAVAWCCVAAGLAIALIYVSYASYETTRRKEIWFERERRSESASRLRQAIRDLDDGLRPAWVVMSPWPGVITGAAVTGLGGVVLLIRPPQRSTAKGR